MLPLKHIGMAFIACIPLLGGPSASAQRVDAEHMSVSAYGRFSHVLDGHSLYDRLLNSYNYDLYGANVRLSTRPEDGNWFERAWNYPSFSLGLSYARMGRLDFKGASRLGDILNLQGAAEFDLLRLRRFRLGPLLELGLSWSPVRYDFRTNPDNFYIGSHWFAVIGTGLRAEWLITQHWSLDLGVYLTHHSNGMLRAPNLGINELAFGAGIHYYLTPTVFSARPATASEEPRWRKGLQWSVFTAAGVHSCPVELDAVLAAGGPKGQGSPVPARLRAIVGAELIWRYAPVFASGLSAELGYAANDYRTADRILAGREDPNGYSPIRAGIGLVQEFWYRDVSVHVVLGVYAFKRSGLTEDVSRTFQKIGIRYQFRRSGLFAGLDLRAHQLDRSYSLEWSLGKRF